MDNIPLKTAPGHILKRCALLVIFTMFFGKGVLATPLRSGTSVVSSREIHLKQLDRESVPADVQGAKAELLPETMRIIRSVDQLWLLEIADEHMPVLAIEYSVVGANGKPGVFSSAADPSSVLRVEIRPKGLRAEEFVEKHWLMSEGVDIILHPEAVTVHGAYNGTIRAVITASNI